MDRSRLIDLGISHHTDFKTAYMAALKAKFHNCFKIYLVWSPCAGTVRSELLKVFLTKAILPLARITEPGWDLINPYPQKLCFELRTSHCKFYFAHIVTPNQCCGSKSGVRCFFKTQIRDLGWKKIQIRDEHPGSYS
jgi:hypothetical protein